MSRYRFSGANAPYAVAEPNCIPDVTVTFGKIGCRYLSDIHCPYMDR
jgi:hypothetical protein